MYYLYCLKIVYFYYKCIFFSNFSKVKELKSFYGRKLLEDYHDYHFDSVFLKITSDNFKVSSTDFNSYY